MARGRKRDSSRTPGFPNEYTEMLREYAQEQRRRRMPQAAETETSFKRQKTASPSPPPPPPPQAYESESESDDWENVDVAVQSPTPDADAYAQNISETDVVVSLEPGSVEKRPRRALPPRPVRILMHKLGIRAWLLLASRRNAWISGEMILGIPSMKHFLAEIILSELFASGPQMTDFLKSKKRVDGLRHAITSWQARFRVTPPTPFGHTELLRAFTLLEGPLDAFCIGFCAMLRASGIEARLVCSLQPPDINIDPFAASSTKQSARVTPVWWTEVWDPWAAKYPGNPGWIVCDVLSGSVQPAATTKPQNPSFEPPATSSTILRYVLAFSTGPAVRDVTRTYAAEYVSRVRKRRIDYIPEGEKWYLQLLSRRHPRRYAKRDAVELRNLVKVAAHEGLPHRIQDFAGHPEYVLETGLKRGELLRPGAQPIGTQATGNGRSRKLLKVFQRADVIVCHSAQYWYRLGYSVMAGAQPLLRRPTPNRLTGETDEVALYSRGQVEQIEVQPVIDGIVPKSEYRTIDLFVPSMLPRGAVHIVHPRAVAAAKLIGVDYANAVVGIDFGREGPKSVLRGVVVAEQYALALRAVCVGYDEQDREIAALTELRRIYGLWRQFISGIQIWERIERMNPDWSKLTEGNKESNTESESDSSRNSDDPEADEVESEWASPSDDELEQQPSSDPDSDLDPSCGQPSVEKSNAINSTEQNTGLASNFPTSSSSLGGQESRSRVRIPLSNRSFSIPGRTNRQATGDAPRAPHLTRASSSVTAQSSHTTSDESSDFPELLDELSESDL